MIVLEHVLIVTIAVGFLWIMSYPMLRTEALAGRTAEKYEDTVSFEKNLQSLSYDVIDGIRTRELIETDGAYVPGRIVDIREFYENSRITDEDVNGLSYTLEELEIWGRAGILTEAIRIIQAEIRMITSLYVNGLTIPSIIITIVSLRS